MRLFFESEEVLTKLHHKVNFSPLVENFKATIIVLHTPMTFKNLKVKRAYEMVVIDGSKMG